MALPSSPPISMAQIYAEFGGAGQPLTAFVRGGAYVPNTGPNAGVPTAPPISLLNFLGASAGSSLSAFATPASASQSTFIPEPAPFTTDVSAGVNITPSGGTGGPYSYSWAYLSGDAAITFNNTGTPAGKSPFWNKSIAKNSGGTGATWRCTVGDGVNTVIVDVPISLDYNTDA